MVNPVVILYLPATTSTRFSLEALEEQLSARGLQMLVCLDPEAMASHCQRSSPAPGVVLLAGSQAENCAYAQQLRVLHARVGLLATVLAGADDSLALEVIQSGADGCVSDHALHLLISALICRLWWRVAGEAWVPAVLEPKAVAAPSATGWGFPEQGWVVVSPGGCRLALTTGERAFMCALLAAPGKRASHRDLIDAINQGYALDDGPLNQSRLGVMVSRLRRKFNRHGLEMPVKSLHSWGYMFTGLCNENPISPDRSRSHPA